MEHHQPIILIYDSNPQEMALMRTNLPADCDSISVTTRQMLMQTLAVESRAADLLLIGAQAWEEDPGDLMAGIKRHSSARLLPVMVVLPEKDHPGLARALILGATDIITQPLDPVMLKLRLRTQLNLRAANRVLEQELALDSLTRLPTSSRFKEWLTNEWRRAMRLQTPLSMMLMEIDQFARIVEIHGYNVAEEGLCRMAQVLKDTFTRSADFVAFLRDGRFAALLPETDAAGAAALAEKSHAAIRKADLQIESQDLPLRVTMSLGVATLTPTSDVTYDALMTLAQEMLAAAQSDGRDGFRCSPVC